MTIALLLKTVILSALIGLGVAEVIKAALVVVARSRWTHRH